MGDEKELLKRLDAFASELEKWTPPTKGATANRDDMLGRLSALRRFLGETEEEVNG